MESAYRDFEELVQQIREEDPRLGRRMLAPDGRYQTREVSMDAVLAEVTEVMAKSFAGRSERDLPRIVIGWGKCRVGSTALTNLFGIAGTRAYYMPVKTAMRHRLLGSTAAGWDLPHAEQAPVAFAKEMAGPYLLVECMFNPVEVLIKAGFPASHIDLMVLEREPVRSLDSWLSKWTSRVGQPALLQHYILSTINAARIRSYARRAGVRVTHFVYEASREPEITVKRLFTRLGIERYYTADVVQNWNERGALSSANSLIIYPDEPAPYIVPGLHGSETEYRYKDRKVALVTAEHRELLDRFAIADYYAQAALACAEELQLDRATRERMLADSPLRHGSPA